MQLPLQAVEHWLSSLGWASVITFFATATWGVFRLAVKVVKVVSEFHDEWEDTKEAITYSKQMLDTVANNHLNHIQDASERTARALEAQNFVLSRLSENVQQSTTVLEGVKSFLEAKALYETRPSDRTKT